MLLKKLKLLPKWQQVLRLKTFIFAFFFVINTAVPIHAQNSSEKLKDYILQQIQSSQKQKKDIYSILTSLETDIKKSHHLIESTELEISAIKKNIKKKEKNLTFLQEELDKILKQIYQKFFQTYLLEKIKQSSFLPTLDYFKNYSRNKEIVNLLLTEEILISENLFQKAELRKKQLQKLQQAKNRLKKKNTQLEVITQKFLFKKKQYQLFLKKVEKQQQENHKVFAEIEKNIGAYEKHSSSKTIFNTKNKNLPVRGQVFQPFGKQNEKISFYHKKGILIETNANESVRAVTKGKVVFVDKVIRYNYIIILDHGNANFSIYGRLHNVAVKKGDTIAARQKIASVLPYAENKHLLYFAVRNGGKAIDPLPWITQ